MAVVFVVGYLVLPELLKVNKLPSWLAWVALSPLLLIKLPDQGRWLTRIRHLLIDLSPMEGRQSRGEVHWWMVLTPCFSSS